MDEVVFGGFTSPTIFCTQIQDMGKTRRTTVPLDLVIPAHIDPDERLEQIIRLEANEMLRRIKEQVPGWEK